MFYGKDIPVTISRVVNTIGKGSMAGQCITAIRRISLSQVKRTHIGKQRDSLETT